MQRLTALIAGSALMGASLAFAQQEDVKASAGVDHFMTYCAKTVAQRPEAEKKIAANSSAVRLPDATAQALQGNKPGGAAWVIGTPDGARLMVEYWPSGVCCVRIFEADEAATRARFDAAVTEAAKGLQAKITQGPEDFREKDGARLTTRGFVLEREGWQAKMQFSLTTADRRVSEQQHFMTLVLVK